MDIGVDTNQMTGTHKRSNEMNHRRMMSQGHSIFPLPLPYGDYIEVTPEIAEVVKRRGCKLGKMDLMNDIKIAVDRKRSLDEICGNLCSNKEEHERFREELIRAQKAGCTFYVLIETTEKIKSVQDVLKWSNPRLHKYNRTKYMHSIGKWKSVKLSGKRPPCDNVRLMNTMLTVEARYGCKFLFCSPYEAADKIVELLKTSKGEGD